MSAYWQGFLNGALAMALSPFFAWLVYALGCTMWEWIKGDRALR